MVQPGSPSLWPTALRATAITTIPILVGVAVGDVGAGLIATLGGWFTGGFGLGRPYLHRGVLLGLVAVGLAGSVSLGVWAASIPALGVLTVSAVAVAAVWLCHALAVGPPGAYMFVASCAVGVGASASHLAPWRVGLLVLAGGALAWVLQMAGALTDARRPERSAVAAAAEAVAQFVECAGGPEARVARHRAAEAMDGSWAALGRYQPVEPARTSVLFRLRAANRELQVLFASAVAASVRGEPAPPGTAERVRQIGLLREDLPGLAFHDEPDRAPVPRPGPGLLLAQAVRPGSQVRYIMVRVAVAVPVAGSLAALMGVSNSYWAMAAAVLMLHQGSDRLDTLRLGAQRLGGTWVGLVLAGVILVFHPHGVLLAPIVAALQFSLEMLKRRSYLAATVFITAEALIISAGTRRVDVSDLLLARGLDTLIGCAVGIAVFLLSARLQEATRLQEAIAATLDAVTATSATIAVHAAGTAAVRAARRDLLWTAIAMREAEQAALAGSSQQRAAAWRLGPTVLAVDHLAYRTLAVCWASESDARERETRALGAALFGADGPDRYLTDLADLAAAVRDGSASPPTDHPPPEFVAFELAELRESLSADPVDF